MGKNALRSALVVSAVVAVAALTGCTSGPAPSATPTASPTKTAQASTQTHAEACSIVTAGLKDVASLQGEVSADNPAKSIEVLGEVDTKVAAIDAKVTNEKVKALTSDAAASIHAYSKYLKGVMQNPAGLDVNEITAKAQALAAKFTAAQKECA